MGNAMTVVGVETVGASGKTATGAARLRECRECGARCCLHVALQIDTPTCKTDYDNIRWYLMHREVLVFVDHDGNWHIEISAQCERLGEDFRCTKYDDRPSVCRSYPAADEHCEYESDDSPYSQVFRTAEEFEAYLDGKKKEWRWKRM